MRVEVCDKSVSCSKCKHKCREYMEYMDEKTFRNLMQGEDRQPMRRKRGALTRK